MHASPSPTSACPGWMLETHRRARPQEHTETNQGVRGSGFLNEVDPHRPPPSLCRSDRKKSRPPGEGGRVSDRRAGHPPESRMTGGHKRPTRGWRGGGKKVIDPAAEVGLPDRDGALIRREVARARNRSNKRPRIARAEWLCPAGDFTRPIAIVRIVVEMRMSV